MPSAVFRCDANPEIGTGHVVRCAAFAEELGRRGWQCRFISLPGTRAVVSAFMPATFDVIETATADRPDSLRELAHHCDLLVIDSYRLDREFERAISGVAERVLVIDDLASRPHEADILLDQTLGRTWRSYDGLVGPETRRLLGSAYALLRPAFAATRRAALQRHLQQGPLRVLLVAIGGSPSLDSIALVAEGVRASGLKLQTHVVGNSENLRRLPATDGMIIHSGRPDIHALMVASDVAIGAGGGSAWERCCLGLPSLVVQVADNQKDVASSLAAHGAAIDLGPIGLLSPDAMADALRILDGDPAKRAAMAHRAAEVCDGLGARRVAGEVAPQRTSDGRPIVLRAVVQDDAELLFSWQQHPEVRRFANDPRPPIWDEHVKWLARRLGNPLSGPFSIIMCDGRPAGVLRFDWPVPERFVVPAGIAAGAYLVSILVDPACFGQGIARTSLMAGRDLLPGSTLYAEVLEGNDASHRLFASAGYRRASPTLYISAP